MKDFKLGLEEIIQWESGDSRVPGWDALAGFIVEHMNPADAQDNLFLFHGLFFVKEFLSKRSQIAYFWGKNVIGDYDYEMDKELCGLVVLSWMKYLHKKGGLVWDGEKDVDAMFLVDFKEIEDVRKELESALTKVVVADYFAELSHEDQVKSGVKLRELYQSVLEKAESEILDGFKKSIQFENFLSIVKGHKSKK